MADAPVGFLMALAQNEAAMKRFSTLSDRERERILDEARQVNSRSEMQALVSNIQG